MEFITKNKNCITIFIAGFACISMVLFPAIAFLSAQKGIYLWAGSVLPALLPFFICTNFMNGMGVTKVLKPAAFAFIMSILSGYPVGAKIIGDLKRNSHISERDAKRCLSFCSTSGPAFMIGAVGMGMLGSPGLGVIIAAAHYIGAVLNGAFFSLCLKRGDLGNYKDRHAAFVRKDEGAMEIFANSVFSSFQSLGIILAYIVLFMFLTDLIQLSGILDAFESDFMKSLIKGLIEMTVGCFGVASCANISMVCKCVLCTFIISWGGFSVIGQTMSMLAGCGIRLTYFIAVKLGHCVFSSGIAFLLGSFLL